MKLTRDLREFIELLNAKSVEYVLIDGWAFGYHATPRYTGDIDFFIKCDDLNASRLQQVLEGFGFSDLPGFVESFLQPDRILQFGIPPNRIDLLTQIDGVSFSEAWQSRVYGDLDGVRVPFISRECLLKNKLAAARPKDLADADALKRTSLQ